MLPDRFLDRGINAIARAFVKQEWTWEQFMNGHRGAGTLAGYYLLQDGLTEDASSAPIEGILEAEWGDNPLFAPMPPEPPAPSELGTLLRLLEGAFASSGHVGHNVIYPTFALRVFRQRPDLITRTRCDGIAIMARTYSPPEPPRFPPPEPFASRAFSAWVLESFVRCAELFRGFGQGATGHVLTYAQAVHDLQDLGYPELSRIAEAGYRDFVALVLKGPTEQDRARVQPPRVPSVLHPELASFWKARPAGTMEKTFAHDTKYAYALLKLCRQAQDPRLGERAQALYYLMV